MNERADSPPLDAPSVAQQVDVIAATPPTQIELETVESVDEERLSLENDRLRAEVQNLEQDRAERKKYAGRIFWLVTAWLAGMICVVVLQGLVRLNLVSLSDNVLIALVTTTTGGVVGLLVLVVKYLFPSRS